MSTDKMKQLEQLRGAHDQTMRCRMIEIEYGDEARRQGITPTELALESAIERQKKAQSN